MEKELILCDTDIFISWFRGDLETRTRLDYIGLENILIPSVTLPARTYIFVGGAVSYFGVARVYYRRSAYRHT